MWTNEELKKAIKALDFGYNMKDVNQAFNNPKSLLRDHYEERVKRRR